jgi:hypothetical protein
MRVLLENIIELKLFSFSAQNISLNAVSIEKSTVILMGLSLYVICFFFLTNFSTLSLFSVLVALMTICLGRLCFGQVGLLSWKLPVSEYAKFSQDFGNFLLLFSFLFFIVLLFICAYKAWVISPPFSHPLLYHSLHPLPLPHTPSIPSRNYFALISNFVEERI